MATLFLLLIYLSFISLGLPDSILGAGWPVMRLDLGAGLEMAGVQSFIVAAGTVVSSLFSERLIRRFGTGRVTAVSVGLTAGALLATSFVHSIVGMFLLAVPLGLGAGAVDSALNNYVALHYQPRHMNWLHSFWGVGAFTGPLIMGAFLQQNGNWRGAFATIGGIQVVVTLLLFLSLPMWRSREAQPTAGTGPKAAAALPMPAGQTLRIPGVLPSMCTYFVYCAAEFSTGLWGASFLVEQRGFTEAAAASIIALYYGGITAGRMASGFLSGRFSSTHLIRLGVWLTLAGATLLALPFGWAGTVGLLLIGLGFAPIYPGLMHETPHRFGTDVSQRVIGWQMASAYCGSTLTPPLLGLLGRHLGMGVFPAFLLAFAVLLLLLTETINHAIKTHKTTSYTDERRSL